jgi:hypothetical protein
MYLCADLLACLCNKSSSGVNMQGDYGGCLSGEKVPLIRREIHYFIAVHFPCQETSSHDNIMIKACIQEVTRMSRVQVTNYSDRGFFVVFLILFQACANTLPDSNNSQFIFHKSSKHLTLCYELLEVSLNKGQISKTR